MSASGQEITSRPHRTACARTVCRNSSARPHPSSSRYTRAQCAATVSGKKIFPSDVTALRNRRSHRPGFASLDGVPNSRVLTLLARRRAASRSSGKTSPGVARGSSAAAAVRYRCARRRNIAQSAFRARMRAGSSASVRQNAPRSRYSPLAPKSAGSTVCGAVPSKKPACFCGKYTPSSEAGSPAQCSQTTESPAARPASPTRRRKVDLPQPGPPLRMQK